MNETKISAIKLQTIPYNSFQIIGAPLGSGSFGDVYKATWLGKEVAVKELHLNPLSTLLQAEFKDEAQMMVQFQSPNIIGLYGICDESGHKGFVMEYMPKGSLRGVLADKNEEMSWDARWMIAIDIGKGLGYLHQKNILHRDLKSLNILLGTDYHAKICDFGLPKIKLETSINVKINQALSSARWMAPELLSMDNPTSPTKSSDVYSYGMVLWEISSREIPFKNAQNEMTAMMWIANKKKESILPDCPKVYGDIIKKIWQDADNRPSAEEVFTCLTKVRPEVKSMFIENPHNFFQSFSMNTLAEIDLVEAGNYVLNNYISLPYSLKSFMDDWNYQYGNETIQRPNHGLAHTLRTVFYAPYVVKAFLEYENNKYMKKMHSFSKGSVDKLNGNYVNINHEHGLHLGFNENNTKNLSNSLLCNKIKNNISLIQLALIFFVAGRENEMGSRDNKEDYDRFRKNSAEAFKKYIEEKNLKFDQEIYRACYDGILKSDFHKGPIHAILKICHDIDTMRCFDENIYKFVCDDIIPFIGREACDTLISLVEGCLIQTGDRILASTDIKSYNGNIFIQASQDVKKCKDFIQLAIEKWENEKIEKITKNSEYMVEQKDVDLISRSLK